VDPALRGSERAQVGEVSLPSADVVVQDGGKALVKLACTGASGCRGKLTRAIKSASMVKRKKKTAMITIATANFSIAGGSKQAVMLKLDGPSLLLLGASHGSFTGTLKILELDSGPSVTQVDNVALLLDKASRGHTKKKR